MTDRLKCDLHYSSEFCLQNSAMDRQSKIAKTKRRNYTKYIATRESVEKREQNIPIVNMKWYAAFHDTTHHPHIHLLVYSKNPKQGYLTNEGIKKIRSAFANDIYHDELYNLYSQQTNMRDLLKKGSAEIMSKLAENISAKNSVNDDLKRLVSQLKMQLDNSKGKKVYGYLKPEVKQTVDEIFYQLAQNETIQKMYKLWCEMEQAKHDVYSSAKVKFPPLVDNPQFKSVKNMIIKTVLEIDNSILTEKENLPLSLAKLYLSDEKYDLAKAVKLLEKACEHEHIKPYAAYAYAKVLLDDNEFHDSTKAVKMLEENTDNNWCSYLLGKLYLFGNDEIEKDKGKAVELLTESADNGNEYAENLLKNIEDFEQSMFTNAVLNLFVNLSRIIEDNYSRSQRNLQSKADRKLRQMIRRKKEEIGIRSDNDQQFDH